MPATYATSRLGRLADVAFRRRRLVLLAWAAALVVTLGLSAQLKGAWTADYSTPGSDSRAAAQLLQSRFPERSPDTVDVVWKDAAGARSPAASLRLAALLATAQRLPGVGEGVTVSQGQVSRDGRIGLARLQLTERPADVPKATGKSLLRLADRASGGGVRVELGGQVIEDAQQGAISSEAVGLAIAALVLLVTFGSMIAAGLPMATAVFGLGISSALVGLLAAVVDVPDWAPQVAAMIGIGVGIDYALLVITRYRAALAAGRDPHDATVESIATAGRAVMAAGTTVVVSMLGLFLMGLPYLYGVALSSSVAVLVVMAAAVTLLPALLGFARTGVNRLRLPGTGRVPADPSATPAARWSRAVQRRPWAAAVAGVAVLLALAVPVTGLRLGFPDAGNDRADTTTRQAYDLLSEGFGAGANGPLLAVAPVRGGGERAAAGRLATTLEREPGVAAVSRPQVNRAGDAAVLTIQPTTSPQASRTEDLVKRLRSGPLAASPLDVKLGGRTAEAIDQGGATAARLPLFIGGVVGLSFLLLLVVFRSVPVPLKAGVMNLLSIGAAYGVVSVFAHGGVLGGLIGIDTPTPVPPFIPVMMFAILFGLSMDYEVFLLSRVREEFAATGSTARAVTDGLARTARVITAAAVIMVAVFGAFVLSDQVFLQLIGVGLATAILVDATVVRMVLVPAVMQILGDRNWWLPGWLDRVLPRAELEPAPAPAS
jgi:RND superfamily putative drug exporter